MIKNTMLGYLAAIAGFMNGTPSGKRFIGHNGVESMGFESRSNRGFKRNKRRQILKR